MNRIFLLFACLTISVVSFGQDKSVSAPTSNPASTAASKMTNADVVEMFKAGLSEQVIITSIRQAPTKEFDLTPPGLIALKKAGVSDTVIQVLQEVSAPAKSLSVGSSDKTRPDVAENARDDANARLKQELMLIVPRLVTAQKNGDQATINKLLPDDFVFGKSALKADYMQLIKAWSDYSFTVEIADANLGFEGETAVLTGVQVIRSPPSSGAMKDKFIGRFVKRDGQWQMVAADLSKYDETPAEPKKTAPVPAAQNSCSGIESLGLYKNEVMSGAIGGGLVEWLAKIRNNSAVTKIVVFGWRDMYGQQKKAQVQIRGGDIATPRLDLTQSRVIPPVADLRVLSCQ